MAASTNLASKLSRAIVNYLVRKGVVPFDRCYYQRCRRTLTLENGPIVSIVIGPGNPAPACTGSYQFPVNIEIKGSALKHPDDPNDETEAVEFDAMVGAVRDALMETSNSTTIQETLEQINTAAYLMPVPVDDTAEAAQFALNNLDMNDFTLQLWRDLQFGEADADAQGCDWSIIMKFDATACEDKLT